MSNGVLILTINLVSISNLVATSLITLRIFILQVPLMAFLALPANSLILIISLLLLVSQLYPYRSLYSGSVNRLTSHFIAIFANCWLYIAIKSLSSLYNQSFFYSFKYIQFQLLQLITYTIFSFFINLVYIIIVKGKIFNYILLSALKLLFAFYTFKFLNMLKQYYTLTSIAFYIISLLPIIFISSLLKLFLLLQSPLKCLYLLESLVWPLLPGSILAFLRVMS